MINFQENLVTNTHSQIIGGEVWDLDASGISSESSQLDRMGEALSRGDYNDDGWQDLANRLYQAW